MRYRMGSGLSNGYERVMYGSSGSWDASAMAKSTTPVAAMPRSNANMEDDFMAQITMRNALSQSVTGNWIYPETS